MPSAALDSKRLRGLCEVERGALSVRWREDPDDGYVQRSLAPRARATASRLSRSLEDEGLPRQWVQPVIVLWAEFEQQSIQSGGVAWIAGDRLAKTLTGRPGRITDDQVQSISAVLRSSRCALRRDSRWRATATRYRRGPSGDRTVTRQLPPR